MRRPIGKGRKPRKRRYRSGRVFKGQQGPARRKMLDAGREAHFKYDMKAILSKSKLDDTHLKAFVQTVFAKGSRNGIPEAKAYVDEKSTELELTDYTRDKLLKIVDDYTRYR